MRWSWKIGRMAGINVYMHATFLLLILFVLFVDFSGGGTALSAAVGVGFVLIVFAFVVLHELGHALTARRYGVETRDIILLPIGGVARLERMPEKPREELTVAIAGPLVNVAIALVLLGILLAMGVRPHLTDFLGVSSGFVEDLMIVNVWLVAFNLLPAFPMDGGRVLRALLAMRTDYAHATKAAARVGQGMALLFGIAAFPLKDPFLAFIAIFVWMGADAESSAAVIGHSSLASTTVGQVMLTDFRTLGPDDTLQTAVDYSLGGRQQDFPVVWGDRVLGFLSHEDLTRTLAVYGADTRVRHAMRRDFPMADTHDRLDRALALLQACRTKSIPVQHDGRLAGILSAARVSQLLSLQPATRGQGTNGRTVPAADPQTTAKTGSDPVKF